MTVRSLFVVLALSFMASLNGCGAAPPCAGNGAGAPQPRKDGSVTDATADPAGDIGPGLCSQGDLIPHAATGLTIESWNRLWFIALGKRCACWEGKLLCVDPKPPQCFWNGRWYGEAEAAHLAFKWCSCRAAQWNCADKQLALRSGFIFPPRETAFVTQ